MALVRAKCECVCLDRQAEWGDSNASDANAKVDVKTTKLKTTTMISESYIVL
jgi:hypothetical protein